MRNKTVYRAKLKYSLLCHHLRRGLIEQARGGATSRGVARSSLSNPMSNSVSSMSSSPAGQLQYPMALLLLLLLSSSVINNVDEAAEPSCSLFLDLASLCSNVKLELVDNGEYKRCLSFPDIAKMESVPMELTSKWTAGGGV